MQINYFKYLLLIFLICNNLQTQDTINFKLFDSLKTYNEDNFKGKSKIDNKFISDPDNIDVKIFRSINNSQSQFKSFILNYFDNSALPVNLIMPISLFSYSRIKKNYYDENTAILNAVSGIANLGLTLGIKYLAKRERPYAVLKNVNYKQKYKYDKYSFPSAHSSTSFSLAAIYTLRYPKYPQIYVPMYLWAITIAYARPYFGMHYPSDVIVGALIGSGSSILIYSLRKEIFKLKNNLLGEKNDDQKSINSKTAYFFAGAFSLSIIINHLFQNDDFLIKFNSYPDIKNNYSGINISLKL